MPSDRRGVPALARARVTPLLAVLLATWALASWRLAEKGADAGMVADPDADVADALELPLGLARTGAPLRPAAQRLRIASAEALERELDALDYAWPPRAGVPLVEVDVLPADLDQLPVARKKALFFRSLLPLVLAENEQLRRERAFLEDALGRLDRLSAFEREQLRALQEQYRVAGDLADAGVQAQLRRRIDVIPPALVLAQAANESGWGTSRFAREGNNLFGIWTFDQRRGLRPGERAEGARHNVRVYRRLRDSVRHYVRTLNSFPAYREFRRLRELQRRSRDSLDALELARGLLRYSERGEAYVAEIQTLIRSNRLQQVNRLHLQAG